MPLLFALGQHEALQAVSRQLRPNERLFAFLDVYLTSKVDWVGACYTILEEKLRVHACTRIHLGKTKVWNQAGLRPPVCDVLERLARIDDPTATVWKRPGLPKEHQGIKVLGSLLGHPPFVAKHLKRTSTKHQVRLVWVVTSLPLCVCSRQPLAESRF